MKCYESKHELICTLYTTTSAKSAQHICTYKWWQKSGQIYLQ